MNDLVAIKMFKEWKKARRRASRIRQLRDLAAERGVSTWGWSDEEVITSPRVACAVATHYSAAMTAVMKSLSRSVQHAGVSFAALTEGLKALSRCITHE